MPAENPEEGTEEDSQPGAEAGGETEEARVLRTRPLRGRYVT